MKSLLNSRSNSSWVVTGLTLGLLLISYDAAQAEVVRTGPNGTTTTQRQIEDNTLIRTTTGPDGQSATTTTTAEDGTVTRSRTGPDGQSATTTHEFTVEEGQVTRESTGPRGNSWEVQRTR